MARSYQVTVGPNKTLLADKTKGGGPVVSVSNPSGAATNVYIGGDENEIVSGATITSVTGYSIVAGGSQTFILQGQEALYGTTNTNTVTVHIIRSG